MGMTMGREMPAVRRLNLFWLAVTAALLVIGCVTAGDGQPALWQSWRGPVMILTSLAFLGWYLLLMPIRARTGWPIPPRVAYPYLATGFVLTAVLFSFSQSFSGALYVLIGLSVSMRPLKGTVLPVGLAVLLYLADAGVLPLGGHRLALPDALWAGFSILMGAGISYALAALIGERFRRERLFQELSEAHRRLRLSAAQDVELAALRERNRLAREMHDSLGHALVLIAVRIEAAQRLQAVDPTRATSELEETKALVRETMGDLRSSLAGLRLPALDEQHFGAALAELASDLGRRGDTNVEVAIADEADALDRAVQEALYRVAQEALANVAKHAQARRVRLTLSLCEETALLEVCDDGVGLGASPRPDGGHYGVVGMRERMEALGGVLTLGPGPGGGTLLRASVPIAGVLMEEGIDVRHPHPVG